MRLIIGGVGGTGKSTLAWKVSTYLSIPHLSVGGALRKIATQERTSLAEIEQRALLNPEFDLRVDGTVREFLFHHPDCVVDGWFAWYSAREVANTIKLKLTCNENARLIRLANREGREISEIRLETAEREKALETRFVDRYHITDWNHDRHYDRVIDTSYMNPDAVFTDTIRLYHAHSID